jgi:hypothetical protein
VSSPLTPKQHLSNTNDPKKSRVFTGLLSVFLTDDYAMANVRLSSRGLNIGFIVTSLVLLSLFVTSYHSYQVANRTLQKYTRLERLLGKVEYENEVLSTSARLATATGQTTWKDRHTRYTSEINGLIAEVQKLPLEGQDKNLQALESTRKTLTAIESKAMKGQRATLQGASYTNTLKNFATAKKELTTALGEQADDDLNIEMTRNRVAMVVSSVCAVISLLAWSMVLSVFKAIQTKSTPLAPLSSVVAYNDQDARDNRQKAA